MFLINKYHKWYFSIIATAAHRINQDHTVNHHIIPEAIGGPNTTENLVKLTEREHFICHLLLTKMLTGIALSKMLFAAHNMMYWKKGSKIKIGSRTYENLRREFSLHLKQLHKDGQFTLAYAKIAQSNRGKIGYWRGKVLPDAHRFHISKSLKLHFQDPVNRLKTGEATSIGMQNLSVKQKISGPKSDLHKANLKIAAQNRRKGMIWVHRNGLSTKIYPEFLTKFQTDGWTRGRK